MFPISFPESKRLRAEGVHGYEGKLQAFCIENLAGDLAKTVSSERKMAGCNACNYITMSRVTEEHVIRGHYVFEYWERIEPRQSFFFANRISPQELFHVVQNIPRCQLRQLGWSRYGRFLYTIQFPFDVGYYPRQGPESTTNKVMIVCDCQICPDCGINVPTDIVTVYPWDEYYAQYGWY